MKQSRRHVRARVERRSTTYIHDAHSIGFGRVQIVAQFVLQIGCRSFEIQTLTILSDGFFGDPIVRLVRGVDILHLGRLLSTRDENEDRATDVVLVHIFVIQTSDSSFDSLRIAEIGEFSKKIVLDASNGILILFSLDEKQFVEQRFFFVNSALTFRRSRSTCASMACSVRRCPSLPNRLRLNSVSFFSCSLAILRYIGTFHVSDRLRDYREGHG